MMIPPRRNEWWYRLGTGLRASSVMLKIPKLYKKLGDHGVEEEDLSTSMGLQARGSRGEHSPPENLISPTRVVVSELHGFEKLIAVEEAL